jgi:PAP2 superfamily
VAGSVVVRPQHTVVVSPSPPTQTPEPAPEHGRQTLRAFLAEAVLIALLIGVYQGVRYLASGQVSLATEHAEWIWRLERLLRLPSEATLQEWALDWPSMARLANIYYVSVHFPVTGIVLVWLFLRHRAVYLRSRSELVLLTVAGLVVEVLFPLAPPRLVPSFGMIDTMVAVGPSAYSSPQTGLANQYAAMPSLHVGWALLVAVAVIRALDSRWRWLALLHPMATMTVVLVTANHYWLDGIVAAILLAISMLLVRQINGISTRAAALRPLAT